MSQTTVKTPQGYQVTIQVKGKTVARATSTSRPLAMARTALQFANQYGDKIS